MKFHDFKIGLFFYTNSGKWLCTDIGTRTVVAYKLRNDEGLDPTLTWDLEDNIVFYPYNFKGCQLTPFKD